ncbi:hypothetical protein [Photobacterium leiognathi]|uniref:hypothetical protein n=1 Tax=Photobacterium leiognathi TaxID=553611 RepID=UPI002982A298|nr:hypothetical protein [Photobacterium leiognathi]
MKRLKLSALFLSLNLLSGAAMATIDTSSGVVTKLPAEPVSNYTVIRTDGFTNILEWRLSSGYKVSFEKHCEPILENDFFKQEVVSCDMSKLSVKVPFISHVDHLSLQTFTDDEVGGYYRTNAFELKNDGNGTFTVDDKAQNLLLNAFLDMGKGNSYFNIIMERNGITTSTLTPISEYDGDIASKALTKTATQRALDAYTDSDKAATPVNAIYYSLFVGAGGLLIALGYLLVRLFKKTRRGDKLGSVQGKKRL